MAFQVVIGLEKITTDPKTGGFTSVNQISSEQRESDWEIKLEIDAVQAELTHLEFQKKQHQGSECPKNSGHTGGTGGNMGKYDPKSVIWRCCNKKGHMQVVCSKHILKNAQGRVNEVSEQQNGTPMVPISQPLLHFALYPPY